MDHNKIYFFNCLFLKVGPPLPCNNIKLVDVQDMEYFAAHGQVQIQLFFILISFCFQYRLSFLVRKHFVIKNPLLCCVTFCNVQLLIFPISSQVEAVSVQLLVLFSPTFAATHVRRNGRKKAPKCFLEDFYTRIWNFIERFLKFRKKVYLIPGLKTEAGTGLREA